MIAALEPCSFVDYPGKLAAVVFVRGCNLRCPYCHNKALLSPGAPTLDEGEVLRFLESRTSQLDGVVISGGEPTLWDGLPAFCAAVHVLGYKVKLDTNGTRPDVLASLVSARMVDYVAMDLKGDAEDYRRLGWCADEQSNWTDPPVGALRVLMASTIEFELRTTVTPQFTLDKLKSIATFTVGAPMWFLQAQRDDERRDLVSERQLREWARAIRQMGINCVGRSGRQYDVCVKENDVRKHNG